MKLLVQEKKLSFHALVVLKRGRVICRMNQRVEKKKVERKESTGLRLREVTEATEALLFNPIYDEFSSLLEFKTFRTPPEMLDGLSQISSPSFETPSS